MRWRERLNIILMRDNGSRRSYRVKGSHLFLAVLCFCCLPLLCLLLGAQCWQLWRENDELRQSMARFEADYQAAESHMERLQNLEELLRQENVPAREIIVATIAEAQKGHEPVTVEGADAGPTDNPDDPGHGEFPILDNGSIKVSNVQARAMRGNSLRIGLDLRNMESDKILSGEVGAVLITANGGKYDLSFAPKDVGNFRISRFKRTVMVAQVPRDKSLVNAQVILEVKNQDNEAIYRNIYAVQH